MAAEVRETHISSVFLSGDRAYKLLKRVPMPFLDLTDRATRLAAAVKEFECNRRLAPDVYLGLADVHEAGELVDHLIVMRRLPTSRRLSSLIHHDGFADCVRQVARSIAAFHAGQPPVAPAPMASRDSVAANWRDNLAVIERHAGTVIPEADAKRVAELARIYLDGRGPLFDRRIVDGMVRDGHGDLLADDIFCLDDGPRIIDCLAFNDDYRIGDVLLDVAFLAMDLELIADPSIAQRFLGWYREFSDEHHPASLAHHYIAYRSHVRAKVACLRLEQGHAESADLARAHHALALAHLEPARVRMVMVGGGPGVGKSALAEGLGAHYACPVLSTDEIRKHLLGIPLDEHRVSQPGEGIYRPETIDAVYREQLAEAELLVANGESVILDASWSHEHHREAVREAAARHHAELTEIQCVLDTAVAKDRIAARFVNRWNPSDATPEVVDHLAANHDAWPHAHRIDTDDVVPVVRSAAIDIIDGRRTQT